jgi:DNA transformation protein and related proteins
MAGSTELVDTILDLLAPWRGVTARRLFSGHGLYRDGTIFAIVIRDTFYLKVDERTRDDFVSRGMDPFIHRARRGAMSTFGYYEAPPELFDDGEEMISWSKRALDAALRVQKSKKKRPRN